MHLVRMLADDRKIDVLGRLVLPAEARRALGIGEGSSVDIYLGGDEETLLIRASISSNRCFCCGAAEHLRRLPNGRYLCESCIQAAV